MKDIITKIEQEINEIGMDEATLNACTIDELTAKYVALQTIRERVCKEHNDLIWSDAKRYFETEKEFNAAIALIQYYQTLIHDYEHNNFFRFIKRPDNPLNRRFAKARTGIRNFAAKDLEDYKAALAELD